MNTARDPRTDPRPGDEVENMGFTAQVMRVESGNIRYAAPGPQFHNCTLAEWLIWARNATVIHAAPEAES
jgi:hypothetical protein